MTDLSKLKPIFDADVLVYSCGFAADAQKKKEFKEQFPGQGEEAMALWLLEQEYLPYALANTKSVIEDVANIFSKDFSLYLTGSGNYRERISLLLPYKGNRDPNHKPKYYRDVQQYLREQWGADVVHGREADDAIGCHQWQAWMEGRDDTVIVSIDKDLDNIPGYHYNWRKKEFYYIDLPTADRKFWTQVLTGDRTDNIGGIHGIGDAKAAKILSEVPDDWLRLHDTVLQTYEKHGLGYKEFYENASLLWIQRVEGLNFDDQPFVFPEEDSPPWQQQISKEHNDESKVED